MTFPLIFPLYDDDVRAYVDTDSSDFHLIVDNKDLSHEFANLRKKDTISYILDYEPRYAPTLLKTIKALDQDMQDNFELPPNDSDRKTNTAILNVLDKLIKEGENARTARYENKLKEQQTQGNAQN